MTMKIDPPKLQFAFLSAVAAATGVVNAIDTTAPRGALAGALVFGLAAFFYWGRERFDAVNVMSGHGDERTRYLYGRATALMGTALMLVIIAWWLVSCLSGDVNETLTMLTAVGAGSFVAGAIIASRQG